MPRGAAAGGARQLCPSTTSTVPIVSSRRCAWPVTRQVTASCGWCEPSAVSAGATMMATVGGNAATRQAWRWRRPCPWPPRWCSRLPLRRRGSGRRVRGAPVPPPSESRLARRGGADRLPRSAAARTSAQGNLRPHRRSCSARPRFGDEFMSDEETAAVGLRAGFGPGRGSYCRGRFGVRTWGRANIPADVDVERFNCLARQLIDTADALRSVARSGSPGGSAPSNSPTSCGRRSTPHRRTGNVRNSPDPSRR